jgi:hypothetical protein
MNTREVCKYILLEQNCIRNRATCNHNCKDCPCSADLRKSEEAIDEIVNILKARDPFLYLSDNLELLKEALKDVEGKNQEA